MSSRSRRRSKSREGPQQLVVGSPPDQYTPLGEARMLGDLFGFVLTPKTWRQLRGWRRNVGIIGLVVIVLFILPLLLAPFELSWVPTISDYLRPPR